MKLNKNKTVVVLGSGVSINELTKYEQDIINSCKIRIAINKFGAFYKKANILPTHIYFLDSFSEETKDFLHYIVEVLRRNKVKNLTFLLSKQNVSKSRINYLLKQYYFKIKKIKESVLLLPSDSKVEFLNRVKKYDDIDNKWAFKKSDPLFHYRGSFTTVLNYISLHYPAHDILLVGVDFDSPGYFFQDEMEKLTFKTDDWTTEMTQQQKKHFSIIDHGGKKMDDLMPYIIECLQQTNNSLYSLNNSYLVKNNWAKLIRLK